MAKIEKKDNQVTLTMSVDEAVMLQEIVERAGNLSARLKRRSGDNSFVTQEADISMKAMWSLSDHLSIPTDPKHSYTQEFRLP